MSLAAPGPACPVELGKGREKGEAQFILSSLPYKEEQPPHPRSVLAELADDPASAFRIDSGLLTSPTGTSFCCWLPCPPRQGMPVWLSILLLLLCLLLVYGSLQMPHRTRASPYEVCSLPAHTWLMRPTPTLFLHPSCLFQLACCPAPAARHLPGSPAAPLSNCPSPHTWSGIVTFPWEGEKKVLM